MRSSAGRHEVVPVYSHVPIVCVLSSIRMTSTDFWRTEMRFRKKKDTPRNGVRKATVRSANVLSV